jgi:crotonobetainyl-CoA:carnitine CoA-transferase CaiB-like acyl-CoA transferase
VRLPPQRLGAQTQAVLEELEYGAREIEELQESGVIFVASR